MLHNSLKIQTIVKKIYRQYLKINNIFNGDNLYILLINCKKNVDNLKVLKL